MLGTGIVCGGQALREKVMEAKSWDDLLHVITHEYVCVNRNYM